MTREEMAKVMTRVFEECTALRGAGQKEYAHADDRPFRNFEALAEEFPELSRDKVLWILLRKHLDGIKAHVGGHRSQREPVQGRINDAIVYLILLRAMIEEEAACPVVMTEIPLSAVR